MNLLSVFQYSFLLSFVLGASRSSSSEEESPMKILAQKQRPTSAESSWMKRAREARDEMELALPYLQRNLEFYEKSLAEQDRVYAAGLAKLPRTQGTAKVELLFEMSNVTRSISHYRESIQDMEEALKLYKVVTSGSDEKLSDPFIVRGLSVFAATLRFNKIPTSLENWEIIRLVRNSVKGAKARVHGYLSARKYYQDLMNTNPSYDAKSTLEKIEIVLKTIYGKNSEHEVLSRKQIDELEDKIGTVYMNSGIPFPMMTYEMYEAALKKAQDAENAKKAAQVTFVPPAWKSNDLRSR